MSSPLTAPAPAPPLGVFEQAIYKTFETRVTPGRPLLMFTDGIFEVEGPAGDYFDQQRLIAAVERRLKAPSEELLEGLLAETRDYSVHHQFGDDVCLVRRRVGAPPPRRARPAPPRHL